MDLKQLEIWMNTAVSSTSIILFRIVFSTILLIQTFYFFYNDFISENIIKPFILFPFIEGLNPASELTLIIIGVIMLIANIGMIFNKTAKAALLVFCSCFTYFWLLDKGYFNNHYYFISIICFLLFLINPQSSFKQNILVPRMSLLALQVMVVMVYCISGINKLNPYWLFDLQPMTHILEVKYEVTNNPIFTQKWLLIAMCYSGLLFDLFIGFLLIFKQTRVLGFIFVISFNIINFYLFRDIGEIGLFPFLMISTLILFINPNKIRNILKLKNQKQHFIETSNLIKKFILLFLIIQAILPFRHIFFKGNVDYTGVGQRFSWRMKIMYKESIIEYFISDKLSQQKYSVDISKMLTPMQYNNLKYYPDLIIPLANKIKSEARKKFNIKHPKITCNYQTAFMGKNPQLLFSPEIDLTKIATKKLTHEWLWDLKKE